MRQLNAILELEGHYRGKDYERYDAAISELKRSAIGDFPLIYVEHEHDEKPTTVPDFGHNYRCRCENPLPHGVKRYFSLTLYVEGEPSLDDVHGDFEIANGRLIVCGVVEPLFAPDHRQRKQLKPVEVARAA